MYVLLRNKIDIINQFEQWTQARHVAHLTDIRVIGPRYLAFTMSGMKLNA